MPKTSKKAKAVPFNPADVANAASPYVQRVIDDASIRENVKQAIESSRSAYERLMNGRAPHKALIDDKKLQNDLRTALEAVRDATTALTEGPKERAKKGFSFGRKVAIVGLAGGLALAGSEKLRSKVLDTLFGAEEEFEYTPPSSPPPSQSAPPVSAA